MIDNIPAAASLIMGLSVASAAYIVASLVTRERGEAPPWDFEEQRRAKLRADSRTFQWFEPLIQELAGGMLGQHRQLAELQKALPLANENAPWQASEFVVATRLEAGLVAVIGFAAGMFQGGPTFGLLAAGGLAFGYEQLRIRQQFTAAREWQQRLLRKLPFTIDLLTLMMEAGATFAEALQTVVSRATDHPLDSELLNLQQQLEMGRTRRESLEALANKVDSDVVSEIVTAIIKGEELGSPLSKVLRTQSDELLLKRSQWAEKAAADAQVKIAFPGMLVMLACLVIVIAPFLLPLLQQRLF